MIDVNELLELEARKAVDVLRNFARQYGMDHLMRDPLVMDIHRAIDAIKPLQERVRELEAENAKLREAVKLVLDHGCLGNHMHWDKTMQSGAGCRVCIRQREVGDTIKAVLAAKEKP